MEAVPHEQIAEIRRMVQSDAPPADAAQAERLINTLDSVESSFNANVHVGGDVSGTLYVARQIIKQSVNIAFPPALQTSLQNLADRLTRFLDAQAQTGSAAALRNAAAALDSHWPAERFRGVQSLHDLARHDPASGAYAALITALQYPFQDVRVYAIFWLSRSFGDLRTLPLLERIYYNSSPLYENLGDETTLRLLQAHNLDQFLSRAHPIDLIRYLAVIAIGQLRSHEATRLLVLALKDGWEGIRASAAHDLRFAGNPAVPALAAALRDPAFAVRQCAWESLHAINTPEAHSAIAAANKRR